MSQEHMKTGEGFGVSKTPGGGAMQGPTIEERKKQLRKTIAVWGSVAAAAVAIFGYAIFGKVVPAVKEYRSLLQEQVAAKEKLVGQTVQRKTQEGPRLTGYLSVQAFRPDAAGAYLKVGSSFVPVPYSWADRLIATAWAGDSISERHAPSAMRHALIAERGPIRNLIVNAGENFLVDAWQNIVEIEIMKFHGIGTSAVSAAETDTGCTTELTTQYNPDSTRATGSLIEGASTNIFRTVGTNTVDATVAITEWCLLSQAATGGGTMWSRVVFAAVNLTSGDSLQTTYDLTVE